MEKKKVKIGDLLKRRKVSVPILDNERYKRVTIRMNKKGAVIRDEVYWRDIWTKQQFLVKEGDFLISKIDARNGAFDLASKDLDGAIITGSFLAFEINTGLVDREYFMSFVSTGEFQELCKRNSSGTTNRKNVDENKFLNAEIEIAATIEKQKLIAQRVEDISKMMNSADNELGIAQKRISSLRSSILQDAIQGKLVPQDPSDEPAAVLLERIRKEKEDLAKAGKIKKQKELPPISPDEVPFELPKGWEWARLGDISYNLGQKIPDKQFTYIDVSAIDNDKGLVKDEILLLEAKDAPSRARKKVSLGTVIYATVRPYLKNIALIEKDYDPQAIASTAFAILHPHAWVNGKFLLYYLRSESFTNFVSSRMVGVAYPAINDTNFFNWIMPIPTEYEQSRIVAKVDELMADCDKLESLAVEASEKSEKLLESVLGRIFNS